MTAPASIGTPHVCDEDQYPVAALQAGVEGNTILSFHITPQGDVTDITVLNSSGNQSLDDVSIACAKNWHYRPAMQDGIAVQVTWRAGVRWRIQIPTDPPFSTIYAATRRCVNSQPISKGDLDLAVRPTIVRIQFAQGTVASVSAVASSGNPDLDQRIVVCYQNLDPELAATVVGDQKMLIPVDWKLAGWLW